MLKYYSFVLSSVLLNASHFLFELEVRGEFDFSNSNLIAPLKIAHSKRLMIKLKKDVCFHGMTKDAAHW